MCEVPPVFSRVRNSIEDYLNGLVECKIYGDLGQKAKRGHLPGFQSESRILDCLAGYLRRKLWYPGEA